MAPLQLKGCTRTPSLSSTTTPSGASERRHCQCLSSPLRPRGRAGVFCRREGPGSQSFSRGSPSPCSSSLSSVRGFFSSRGWPPADPVGIRPPFVSAVSFRQRSHTIWTSSPCFWSFLRSRAIPSFLLRLLLLFLASYGSTQWYGGILGLCCGMDVSFRRRIVLLMWSCTSSLLLFLSPFSPSSGRLGRVSRAWLKVFTRTPRNSAPWGHTCTGATGRVFPAAIVYLLAPSFAEVNSDRRYLDVDSELRRKASCLRCGSWVSNVSRGEMFEGIVAPTLLGWDQHGLRCLLFGRLFKV